jgi:hypothetical protein
MADILDAAELAAIARYVHEFREEDGVRHTSTFRAALRDARQLGGRNLDTGAIETEPVASWPSSLTYLILLDQIGRVICPAPRRSPKKGDLRDALQDFDPTISDRDTVMLYALRCAFAHECALANQGQPCLLETAGVTEQGESHRAPAARAGRLGLSREGCATDE